MPGNAYYYTSDNTTAPPDIKYNKKSKYEPKNNDIVSHVI